MGLPEMLSLANQLASHRLLQRLHRRRQSIALWLAHQQMHMLRHDDIAGYKEVVLPARLSQPALEQALGMGRLQQALTPVTTEGVEVEVASLLIPLQFPRYVSSLQRPAEASL